MGVVDLVARRVGRVVVHVEDVHASAAEQSQAREVGAALVEVVDVGQDAGVRVAGLDGDEGGLAEPAERLREAPDLDLRARRPSGGPVRTIRDSARRAWCRSMPALSVAPAGGAAMRVPPIWATRSMSRRASSRPFLRRSSSSTIQSEKPIALSTVRPRSAIRLRRSVRRAAAACVLVELANPRLDALVAGLGGEIDFLLDRELLAADRAGIEAEPEGRRFDRRGTAAPSTRAIRLARPRLAGLRANHRRREKVDATSSVLVSGGVPDVRTC